MRALALALTVAAMLAATDPAAGEVIQRGNLRVSLEGHIAPHRLPREGEAPVAVSLTGRIRTTDGAPPPQLRMISLAINRHGRLDYRGLERCNYHQIQPASSEEALEACRRSLVGRGTFKAHVALPEQSPFPSDGEILAFNGNLHGRPVLYAHIYGTEPLPQSFVLPFKFQRSSGGYGTSLIARLPRVAADWGFVNGISLTLERRFNYRGKTRSYLSAGCPAPKGFLGASFPLVRASFGFEDGRKLTQSLTRSCGVRR